MVNVAGKKILLVEDEQALSKALNLKLSAAGFDVTPASNGEAALDYLSKDKYDLMLLDLIMPKKGGFEVLEEINAKKIKVPVFVTTNLGQAEDKEKALKLGAKEYIIKSEIAIKDIVKIVTQYLK